MNDIEKEWLEEIKRIKKALGKGPGEEKLGSTWGGLGRGLPPIGWDWPGWLPQGFVTIVAGEAGVGKSMLCLRLAGTYMEGWPWPDGTAYAEERGKVVWCESEASHALNVARARQWGLDLMQLLSPLPNPLESFRLDNQRHANTLFHLAREETVRLVVIDSLRGIRTPGSRRRSLEHLMANLADLARVAMKPVLLTHHLRKRTTLDEAGQPTIERLLGTSAISQAARMVWVIDSPDPRAPEHRRLGVIKNNLGPAPEPLGLRMDEEGLHFGRAPEPPARRSAVEEAMLFLQELLAAGPLPAHEVLARAEAAGVPEITLRRAKKGLGVKSFRPVGKGEWYWGVEASD